jgi:uncharacterized protein YbcI
MADLAQQPPMADELLEAVNEAMVGLHVRYHGREPATAHTQMLGDDLLACVLGEVYTDVEKTMIELQRQAVVHETRSAFQQAMEQRFIGAVEAITGRTVARFITTHHVGPDMEVEIFVLDPWTQPETVVP